MTFQGLKSSLLATLFLTLALPILAQASSNVSMTVKNDNPETPAMSWLSYTEPAGGMVRGTIILRNQGTDIQSIKVYPADATSNDVGSFILKSAEDNQKGIGLWTVLAQKEFHLKPQEEKEIDFYIRIPKEIPPGQYFGGLIKEEISENECSGESGSCTGNIQIRTRVGNRIYLTIPGEANGEIVMTDASYAYGPNNTINFKFKLDNKGNVGFEPKAIIDIYDFFGNKIETVERSLGKSLPKTSTEPQITWKYDARFGLYSAKARVLFFELDYGQSGTLLHGSADFATAKYRMFIIPWVLSAIGILLLFGIGGFFTVDILHLHRLQKNSTTYTVKENEALEDIARNQKVRWKMIARMNKLSAPYSLKQGQKITVPGSRKKTQK